jgi:hypothetical protein
MFRLAQQKRFGKSSEAYPGQGELFNEAEELVEQAVEADEEAITYTRHKLKPKREKISADIPRDCVIHDISDEDNICDCCQHALYPIGEDTSEKLEFILAQVKVIVNVRPKHACKACEKNGTSNTIKQAQCQRALSRKAMPPLVY